MRAATPTHRLPNPPAHTQCQYKYGNGTLQSPRFVPPLLCSSQWILRGVGSHTSAGSPVPSASPSLRQTIRIGWVCWPSHATMVPFGSSLSLCLWKTDPTIPLHWSHCAPYGPTRTDACVENADLGPAQQRALLACVANNLHAAPLAGGR